MSSLCSTELPGLRSKLGRIRKRIKEEQHKCRLIPRDYILAQLETYELELENAIVSRVGVEEDG